MFSSRWGGPFRLFVLVEALAVRAEQAKAP